MLSLRQIFTTTGISILFGVYSIYNIIEYVRLNDKNIEIKVNRLKKTIVETNNKYIDLKTKFESLSENYYELNNEITNLNEVILYLRNEISILKKLNENTSKNMVLLETKQIVDDVINDVVNDVFCDDICELSSTKSMSSHTMTSRTITSINPITPENSFASKLDEICLNNDIFDFEDVNVKNIDSLECSSVKSQPLTEINWLGLTKKMFFG